MKTDIVIFRSLIRNIVKAGYTVSLFDGQEFVVKRSTSLEVLEAAANSTGEDQLRIRDQDGNHVGTILLVWGNEDETLIADWGTMENSDKLDKIISKVAL